MVPIGGKPILWHIMKAMQSLDIRIFTSLGYKAEVIKDYFLNYRALNSDFTIELDTGNIVPHQLDLWIGKLRW